MVDRRRKVKHKNKYWKYIDMDSVLHVVSFPTHNKQLTFNIAARLFCLAIYNVTNLRAMLHQLLYYNQ